MTLSKTYLIPMMIALGLSAAGCGSGSETPSASDTAVSAPTPDAALKPVIEPWGYPLAAFDRETKPGDDFYRFANGGWLDATPIPSDRSGTGFSIVMRDRNDKRMAEIIESLQSRELEAGSNEQKIRDLYESFMDEDAIETAGMSPFEADIARLKSIETHESVALAMADAGLGIRSVFGIGVGADSKSPTNYTIYASQSGLGLPDKSYYLRDSERLEEQRKAYRAHMVKVLRLLEQDQPGQRATKLFRLEKNIAERHWSRAESRDATRTYNPISLDELDVLAKGFPWRAYMDASGLQGTDALVLRQKSSFKPVAALFARTDVEVWKDYLLFHYVSANADYMPKRFADADFDFYGKVLNGQQQQRARDLRSIGLVNGTLNQALGEIYIDRYFSEESKQLMIEMFENIKAAYVIRINHLEWMTDETKVAAQKKLAAMTGKIAYPDKWRDYSNIDIRPGDIFGNIRRARIENRNFQNARLGTKVDKNEWFSGPQTVNAFYSPTRNEVFIPAGYIQSPLFDQAADAALNYGAIGSIMGHEIGHGFDDQGSRYDADGTLQSWWTEDDRKAFDVLGTRLAEQFSEYEPLPGINVNGRQTLGENIGDLAGMTAAYHAYLISLDGKEAPVLDGFTGPQRFFLGRAQGRRYKRTEESLRQRLLSAPHSPMNLRVNGMIRNMDEWYETFDVKEGDALFIAPEDRVKIW